MSPYTIIYTVFSARWMFEYIERVDSTLRDINTKSQHNYVQSYYDYVRYSDVREKTCVLVNSMCYNFFIEIN